MSTDRQRTIHLPIKQRKLLIADVTRMALEPMTDHQFREQLETLVSYNVCNDGVCQDYLYRAGTLHEPEHLPIEFNGNRSTTIGSCNMDTSDYAQLPVATIPALVSTGITILYFVLKLLNYLTDTKPGQADRKEAKRRTDKEGQPKQGSDQGGRSQSKIPEQTQRHSRGE